MKLTNRFGLPRPIYNAVANDPYDRGAADISVTELIGPARKRVLEQRRADEITEDVSERLWALIGQVTHGILQRADDEALTEQRLFIKRHGYTISGAFDRLVLHEGLLQDYKISSTYALKNGPKPEWIAQQNIYRLMLFEHGHRVNKLEIVVIFRDWQKSKARHTAEYPQLPAKIYDVPAWTKGDIEQFIYGRLLEHDSAQAELPECSSEERWERPATYRLMKNGNSRATSRHATRAEAETALEEARARWPSSDLRIDEEPAYAVRCHDGWCPAAPFCDQAKALAEQQIGGALKQALR